MFAHEIGDSVFAVDSYNHIDGQDALKGVTRGAHVIGAKYLKPKVLAAIRSEKYRVILKKTARKPFEHWFTGKDAVARLRCQGVKASDLAPHPRTGLARSPASQGMHYFHAKSVDLCDEKKFCVVLVPVGTSLFWAMILLRTHPELPGLCDRVCGLTPKLEARV